MKKVDAISLTLSIVINYGILFALAYKPFVKIEDIQTIKVGLVSLDTRAATRFEGKENKDANKQNSEVKTIQEAKPTEKIESKEDKKEIIKENKIVEKEAEKVIIESKEEKKEKPSLKELKKSIAKSKPSSKDLIQKTEGFSPSKQNNSVDRKIIVSGDSNGLVSGSINGTAADGEILILWGSGNKSPSFPDNAKVQGKTGNMLIKIQVNEAGVVISYEIEKGSGVPEIDLAVEKVIGSWNLKMKKKNKIVAGVFYLDYKFDFK